MPTVLSLKKTNNKATKRKNKELSTTKGMKIKETTKKKKRFKKRKALFVVKLFQFLMSNDQIFLCPVAHVLESLIFVPLDPAYSRSIK